MGTGVSQGATALISNALGQDDPDKAFHYFLQAISFGTLLAIELTVVGLLITPTLFQLLGATDQYLGLCAAYMNTILLGTVFILLQSIINAALNANNLLHIVLPKYMRHLGITRSILPPSPNFGV